MCASAPVYWCLVLKFWSVTHSVDSIELECKVHWQIELFYCWKIRALDVMLSTVYYFHFQSRNEWKPQWKRTRTTHKFVYFFITYHGKSTVTLHKYILSHAETFRRPNEFDPQKNYGLRHPEVTPHHQNIFELGCKTCKTAVPITMSLESQFRQFLAWPPWHGLRGMSKKTIGVFYDENWREMRVT